MSGFCGWYASSPSAPELDRMAQPLRRQRALPLRSARCPAGAVALAAQPTAGRLFRDDGLLVAMWGGCAATLARGWRSHGVAGCGELAGSYAFALIDEYRNEAFLGVDRLASRPLYYQMADGVLLFSTCADSLAAHARATPVFEPQALFDYLYFQYVPPGASALRGLQRLGPGETLHVRDGRVRRRRAQGVPRPIVAAAAPTGAVAVGGLADAVPRLAAALDQPVGKPALAVAHALAAQAAARGQGCLAFEPVLDLARHVAERRRWRYARLPGAVRQLLIEPVLFHLLRGVGGAAIDGLRQRVADGVACLPSGVHGGALLARYGAGQVLSHELLAECDPARPVAQLREAWWAGYGQPEQDRLAVLDMEHEVAGCALPAALSACELHGIELAVPALDAGPARATLAPPERPATWFAADGRLRALAYDSLLDLRRRQLVRPGFIDMLLSASLESHADMAWSLMMLEQWLAQRAQAPRARQGVNHEPVACIT